VKWYADIENPLRLQGYSLYGENQNRGAGIVKLPVTFVTFVTPVTFVTRVTLKKKEKRKYLAKAFVDI